MTENDSPDADTTDEAPSENRESTADAGASDPGDRSDHAGDPQSTEPATPEELVERGADDAGAATESASPSTEPEAGPTGRIRTGLLYVGLGVSVLIGLVALWGVYSNVSAAIAIWIDAEYEPLFQAGFDLLTLLGAGLAVSLILRELA